MPHPPQAPPLSKPSPYGGCLARPTWLARLARSTWLAHLARPARLARSTWLATRLRSVVWLLPFTAVFFLSPSTPPRPAPFTTRADARATAWVDSTLATLDEDGRIGQLFMVAAYATPEAVRSGVVDSLIVRQRVGGLIFMQGGPVRQALLTNRYQQLARVPLLIGMDAEWGLGMRLDSVGDYPKQMTLGAVQDNAVIQRMGGEIARQCRRLGVHVNFAPVVDINSNPRNPVIGWRSFGEEREAVADKGLAYMRGLQQNGVMAVAKHFPGHGDTGTDSHFTLPLLGGSQERLTQRELYPFRRLIQDSLMGMLVAHMHVPAFDSRKNVATTLSDKVVTGLLKEGMGFKGLVFTDALNMKGVTGGHQTGEADALALLAGNDVLLFPESVPEAVRRIKLALRQQKITPDALADRVRKILAAKYWARLDRRTPLDPTNLVADLNHPAGEAVKFDLYERAITVARNRDSLLPFRTLDTLTFASLVVNADSGNVFQQTLNHYAPFVHLAIPARRATDRAAYDRAFAQLSGYRVVCVGLHRLTNSADRQYNLPPLAVALVERLQRAGVATVVTAFGTPYSLAALGDAPQLVCAYEDNDYTQQLVPQVLFGATAGRGRLPVSASPALPVGTGVMTVALGRLQYGPPETGGMNGADLAAIDQTMALAIREHATPGGQVLVAHRGRVVWQRAYGHLTYDTARANAVTNQTLYDLASVSKVMGTLQAIMFLYDRGLIDVNRRAADYLPELRGTNKAEATLRDILMHQAGFTAFIPFWERTRQKGGLSPQYYRDQPEGPFTLPVAQRLFTTAATRDSVWHWCIESPLNARARKGAAHPFLYSDLSFITLQHLAEKLLNQPLEVFLTQAFYQPLGRRTLTYRPLDCFAESCIAPTENDRLFRHQQLRGTVHDEGAALLGGVAGHAGLFGTANDLATVLQMNLQDGYYGGTRYLRPGTVRTFVNSYQATNRRGLGWDRPEPGGGGYVSDFASRNSYGHTGYTGTMVWADPDRQLTYVFLSNRLYPDGGNRLAKLEIRKKIQDILYKSLINYEVLQARQ